MAELDVAVAVRGFSACGEDVVLGGSGLRLLKSKQGNLSAMLYTMENCRLVLKVIWISHKYILLPARKYFFSSCSDSYKLNIFVDWQDVDIIAIINIIVGFDIIKIL